MSILYLVVFVLIFSFIISAVSGIVAFFIDMIRFGSPHKRNKIVSSIETYNNKLAEEIEENETSEL